MPGRVDIQTILVVGAGLLGQCIQGESAQDFAAMKQAEVEAVQEDLLKCGLGGSDFEVAYVDDFQSAEAVIRANVTEDEGKFDCLDELESFPILTFENKAVAIAFDEFRTTKHAPRMRAMYEDVLRTLGKLDDLPRPSTSPVSAADVQALARHCDFEMIPNEEGVFLIDDAKFLIDLPDPTDPSQSSDGWRCAISGLGIWGQDHGVTIGFIGNEAYVEESN